MRSINEDELILYALGDSERGEEIARAIEADPAVAARYAELEAVLQAVETCEAPERDAGYEDQVWRRLQWRLRQSEELEPRWRRWFRLSMLLPAGSVAALVVLAFLLGRWSPGTPGGAPIGSEVRERILLVDVGQHLGAAEMVLVEVMNAEGAEDELQRVRERAGEILAGNRIYRQAAARDGDSPGMTAVLDELDRMLMEVRNTPDADADQVLLRLQQTLTDSGTLFKVRVLRTQMEEKARAMQPGQREARI